MGTELPYYLKAVYGKRLRVKIIGGEKPELDCAQPEITLEDAYMYLMNREAKD